MTSLTFCCGNSRQDIVFVQRLTVIQHRPNVLLQLVTLLGGGGGGGGGGGEESLLELRRHLGHFSGPRHACWSLNGRHVIKSS